MHMFACLYPRMRARSRVGVYARACVRSRVGVYARARVFVRVFVTARHSLCVSVRTSLLFVNTAPLPNGKIETKGKIDSKGMAWHYFW